MRHPGEQVDDGVVIQPSATAWIDVVNSIGLDQFTWCSDVWPPRIIRTNSFLSADGNAGSLENTADAAQRHLYPEHGDQVVLDDLGAAFEGSAQRQYLRDNGVADPTWGRTLVDYSGSGYATGGQLAESYCPV
jgi:hypothetical protein